MVVRSSRKLLRRLMNQFNSPLAAPVCRLEALENRQMLSLTVDLRLPGGGKAVEVTSLDQVITIDVYAVVAGSNGDTSDDGLWWVQGAFLSTEVGGGATSGNLTAAREFPFNTLRDQDGQRVDLDGDGDLDVGSLTATSAPPYFYARAGDLQYGTEFKVGTLTYNVNGLRNGTQTEINFRYGALATSAGWLEDGSGFRYPAVADERVGDPIVITTALQDNTPPTATLIPTTLSTGGGTEFWFNVRYEDLVGSEEGAILSTTIDDLDIWVNGPGGFSQAATLVSIDTNRNGSPRTVTYKITAPNGTFSALDNGNYTVYTRTGQVTDTAGNAVAVAALGTVTVAIPGITGKVFQDPNANQVQDAGEAGLSGWTVYIDANGNWKLDEGESSSVTNANGMFAFSNLATGSYSLKLQPQDGWMSTSTVVRNVSFTSGTVVEGKNYAVKRLPVIRGTVFHDANGNGTLDEGESGLPNRKVYVDANDNGVLDTGETVAYTDATGKYILRLMPGSYTIRQVVRSNWRQVAPADAYEETLTATDALTGRNFGNVTVGTLQGYVFNDGNMDGIWNGAEAGKANFPVYIDLNNNGVVDIDEPATYSASGGAYSFSGLFPGTYRIRQVLLAGRRQTSPTAETGFAHVVTLGSAQTISDLNFGSSKKSIIRGKVFNDIAGNSQVDPGDDGLAGWTVYIDANNNGVLDEGERSTVTDENGLYEFRALRAGTYVVRQVMQSGWRQIRPGMPAYTVELPWATTVKKKFGNQQIA